MSLDDDLTALEAKVLKLAEAKYGCTKEPPSIMETPAPMFSPVGAKEKPVPLKFNFQFSVEHKHIPQSEEPKAVVLQLTTHAKMNNTRPLGITDHDTVAKYLRDRGDGVVGNLAESAGLKYVENNEPAPGTFFLYRDEHVPMWRYTKPYRSYLVIHPQDVPALLAAATKREEELGLSAIAPERFRQDPIEPRDKRPPSPPAISA